MVSRRLRVARLRSREKLTNKTLFIIAGVVLAGLIIIFTTFAWIAKDLPSPGKLSQTSQSSTVFYDRDGKVLFELYKDRNRVPVGLNETADSMKQATIAIEDKNFYKHQGISQTGIARAFFSTVFGGSVQGGSTITNRTKKAARNSCLRNSLMLVKILIFYRNCGLLHRIRSLIQPYRNSVSIFI